MPATTEPYILRGFKGRSGTNPENIEDKEFQTLQNWYAKDGVLKRRKGLSRVSGLPYAGLITGCAVYLPSGTNYKVMVGLENGIGKLVSSEIVALSTTTTAIDTSLTELWFMQQYKNSMYCLRADIGELYRSDGDAVNDSGIPAPTVGPTLAEGVAGDLEAGDYEAVYTYYNTDTGAESNPSPVSSPLTLGASKTINWSAVAISSNAQTNARKLYRSLKDQQGEFFHVLTILDNSTLVYAGENALLEDMGLPVEVTNAIPPTGMKLMAVHQERMWLSDGSLVYFSEFGLPESFKTESSLNVQSDDGYAIKGLVSFGEILLILKQSGVYFLSGSDEQSFTVRTLHDKHGCVAPHSVAVSENFAFWFGGDNFYLSDGNKVAAIGNLEVQDIVAGISSSDYGLMQGTVFPEEGWYLVGIPASGVITSWLVYNYRSGAWSTITFGAGVGTPTFIELVPDANGKPVLYCPVSLAANNGHLFRFMDPDTEDDFGTDIACVFQSKNYGFQKEDSMKFMKDIQFLMSTTFAAESVVLTLYADDTVAAQATVTLATTFGKKMWKRIPLANNGTPGNFLSLKCTYSGNSDFTIMGLGFKIVDLQRQVPIL